MLISKNDDIKVYIDDLTIEGSAVGHYEGLAIFVRGGVPGDDLLVHIIKVKKNFAIGIIKEIINPSEYRVENDCPAFPSCGGCSFRNVSYDAELKFKRNTVKETIKRIGKIDANIADIIGCDITTNYRNKGQYPVRIEDSNFISGFYAYKSHRIIQNDNCLIENESFSKILKIIEKWAIEYKVSSYDERSGKGLLRHVYIRHAVKTNETMVCLVINGKNIPSKQDLIDALTQSENIKSICININTEDTNVVLSNNMQVIWGSEYITDILLENKFNISPLSFYQVNHDQCEKLYQKVIEYADLKGDETVVDLYCGAGTIGLSLAKKCAKLYGVEIIPDAIENAKENAKINNINNAEFICGDSKDGVQSLKKKGVKPDVIVVDPPRKGCSQQVLKDILQMNPKRIVYVSCNVSTLARDLQLLEDRYILNEVTPVDMFPRTPHVESVAILEKK